MNIKFRSAFFVVLFLAPISLHSKQTVRVVNRNDCVKFIQKLMKELEEESTAKRLDGKRPIFASEYSALLISLKDKKYRAEFIDKVFKSFKEDKITNVTLESDEILKAFLQGYIGAN